MAASSATLPARSAGRRSAGVRLITIQRQRRPIDPIARQPRCLDDGPDRVSQPLSVEFGAKHAVQGGVIDLDLALRFSADDQNDLAPRLS